MRVKKKKPAVQKICMQIDADLLKAIKIMAIVKEVQPAEIFAVAVRTHIDAWAEELTEEQIKILREVLATQGWELSRFKEA